MILYIGKETMVHTDTVEVEMNRCTTVKAITYVVLRNDKLLMKTVRYFREP